MEKRYIILYADEFDRDVWEGYCTAAGVSTEASTITIHFNNEDVSTDLDKPTEDEIGRPGSIDSDKQFEDYIRNYLESEYGSEVESFAYEFDMRRIYIYNIVWKED